MFFYVFHVYLLLFTVVYLWSLSLLAFFPVKMPSAQDFPWHSAVKMQAPRKRKKKLQILSHVSFRAFLDPLDCLHLFGFSVGFMFYIFLGLATWNHNSAQLRIKSYPNQNSLRVSANSGNPKHVTMFSSVIQDQHRNIDQRHSALVNIGNGTVGTGRSGSS